MIRRILHTELSDVRASLVNLVNRYTFWDRGEDYACAFISDPNEPEWVGPGVGYCLDSSHADNWPEGARLLTIGRVTLAAWGGRTS